MIEERRKGERERKESRKESTKERINEGRNQGQDMDRISAGEREYHITLNLKETH